MSDGGASITHVTDTALWVATFRALEGRRSDAAFDDPWAGLLAGERGANIARAIPRSALAAWGVIIRTSAIDRLIHEALSAGIDTVLNLGAGLDSRPYRMQLPQDLRWIEVDFPCIVELKNAKLQNHRPCCRVERIGMDLLDRTARRELFASQCAASKSTLVITEGVISYLSVHEASTLAADLHAGTATHHWIQDFDTAGRRALPRGWAKNLAAAPLLFEVKDWFAFFYQYGWQSSKLITSFEESTRLNRPYPVDFPYGLIMRVIPKDMRRKILSMSGAVLMQKRPAP